MEFLIAVVICFLVFSLGHYLGKRSKACEIAYVLGALLACAGVFLITLANLAEMESIALNIILPVFKLFGVGFTAIGGSVVLVSIAYARKCDVKEA